MNWYKISLLQIADQLGSPQAESTSEIQRIVKNATGSYLCKEFALTFMHIINKTKPNSEDRACLLSNVLHKMKTSKSDAKIISGILSNFDNRK